MVQYCTSDKESTKYRNVIRLQEGFGFGWTREHHSDKSKFISVVMKMYGGQMIQFKIWKNLEKKKPNHPDWRIRQAKILTFKSSMFMDTDWLRRTQEEEAAGTPPTLMPNLSSISSVSQEKLPEERT